MTSGFDDAAQWSVPVTQLVQLSSQHAVQLVSLPPQQAQVLIAAQGKPADTGGYYLPDQKKTSASMRPSKTLNDALAAL